MPTDQAYSFFTQMECLREFQERMFSEKIEMN